MKSLYKRQLTMMVGIMILSFTLLSAAFMLLSYRYLISEKRDSLERNAGYIAGFTAVYYQEFRDIQDELYSSYVANIALISDSFVIVADRDGNIQYATDGSNIYTYSNAALPQSIVSQVIDGGGYAGLTTLGGIYPGQRYTAGLPVNATFLGKTVNEGLVLVSVDASNLAEMWSATATIFFFSAVVVLLISVVASTLTSAYQARPLNEMAEAARKFGRGDFDVRVTGYEGRCDEISTLAEAFNAMASSLEKVESQRSEFIANVSHELKTPMTTIAGFADGILDGTIPPEREKEYLKVISSETRRLSRLVRKMLDLSRLQSAEYVTAQEQFDISEVMLRVLVSLETKVNAKHLDVDTQLPEDPVEVWGDPDAITQVCYNLLDNAIKFSYEESALGISIVTRAGKAYVSVRNHGDTIPPEELPLVFDRFHKTDHSRSEDRDGVGLGLYIVKTILNNHKENITVTSQDGVTEFTFTLTLA